VDKRRLMWALDVALVVAMLQMIWGMDYISTYGRTTLSLFWDSRTTIFRTGASVLWLAVTWLGMYKSWDRAKRVSPAAVALGAALMVLVLALPWFTKLICWNVRKRVIQEVYGTVMLCVTAVTWNLQRALERANPDAPVCVEASKAYRRMLAAAFAVQATGLVASMSVLRQATWYAAAVSGLVVLALWLAALVREGRGPSNGGETA